MVRFTAAVLVILSSAASTALAAPCDGLTDAQAAERLERLGRDLDRNRRHMQIWNTTWFSIYGTATVIQTGISIGSDGDEQAIYGVGAGRAAIAALAIPIMGVETRAFERSGDVCADLVTAEAILAENVRLHAKGRGWFKHVGSLGLNLAALLTLGLGFDLWERGLIGFGIGMVMGEIQIYTQPMGSRDIGRDDERGVAIVPTATDDSVGIAVGGVF